MNTVKSEEEVKLAIDIDDIFFNKLVKIIDFKIEELSSLNKEDIQNCYIDKLYQNIDFCIFCFNLTPPQKQILISKQKKIINMKKNIDTL